MYTRLDVAENNITRIATLNRWSRSSVIEFGRHGFVGEQTNDGVRPEQWFPTGGPVSDGPKRFTLHCRLRVCVLGVGREPSGR